MKKYLLILAVILFITNSCQDDPLPTKGDIAGRITEEGSNTPIAAATIMVTGAEQSYKTGDDGSYKISGLYANDYSVTVSKQGYLTDTKQLTVVPEKTTPGDFSLYKDIPIANPNFVTLTYDKQSETIELENTRSGEMSFTTQTSKDWLTVSPETGTIASQNKRIIEITADLTTVPFGDYDETLLINVGGASLTIPIQVSYVQPPYINIEKPLADETYKMGETMPILWNSNLTGKVKIDLLKYSSVYYEIKKEVLNEEGGNYTWKIPALDSTTYQLMITSIENESISAISDAFTLIPGPTAPTVITKTPEELTSTTIRIGGSITHIGLQATQVDQYGHVYSKVNPNPTIADNKTSLGSTANPIEYTSTITNLLEGETYYVAAYATNTKGTSYGEVLTITTTTSTPFVETAEVVSITQTSAIAGGNVLTDGGSTITERGICWSTSTPATVDDNVIKDSEAKLGAYTSSITNLQIGTTYYVRAYAKNSSGVGYGLEKQFKTLSELPNVISNTISQLTSQSVTANGDIVDDGGETITSYGFCYSTSSQTPTINDTKIVVGNEIIGEYSKSISSLSPNTQYYLRAYATNNIGTSYGETISFKTLEGKPTVVTNSANAISGTSATISGSVQDKGDSPLTSYGFCYAITNNPSLSDNNIEVGNEIQGEYSDNITGLIPETKYFVRAYATNNIGTSYGNELSFTTPEGEYVSFTSPFKDEEYTVGETHSITWVTNYSSRRIIIEYWNNGELTVLTDNSNITNLNYSWYVPESTSVGNSNTIKFIDYTTLEVLGESQQFIIPGIYNIVKPVDGFVSPIENVEIEWTSNYSGTFKLELYQGSQYIAEIASNVSTTDGQYVWNAQADGINIGEGYRIKFIDLNNTSSFKITEPFDMFETDSLCHDSRDGQNYKVVTIGNQIWFAQNLNYDHETSIIPENPDKNGLIYPSYRDAYCPTGWHMPTYLEWKTLEIYLGMTETDANQTGWRESGSVGKKLKASSGWSNGGDGTDEVGFNARSFNADGWYGEGSFRRVSSEVDGIYMQTYPSSNKYMRCIKD